MATLSDPIKLFIVQALACYDTPSQVAAAVKEQFEVEITRMQVSTYDFGKPTCRGISKKLQAVFEATREKFLADVSAIPIAQQAYRLRVLQRTLTKVEGQGNTAMVSQLLEQAAKESGGVFTNKTKLEHSGSVATPELKLVLHGTAPPPPAN
ncbi:DUF2280 domain-containing protein [Variovorax ginsengisoli]|uniref:DUF2280 domain-containing protein n=1 Tax=Variovorax ginsengisoli TaxID=363844 RepID=A0ABT8S1V2_9BURK|nr:DUF2280 domain-containing protein [Variovorax ginsengisoli]MDN8612782.1 DUF2280 domain-containing protein [Variovorax ginsengisoli]MDO1531952.1 DUF2280 domain-containing protein [Variovorax ginsengisoli]